ncbi:sigma-70 family RNA polymerase sigma factor [Roseobacter sp. HKCCA0434]|uniref:sigma-70 family RNA polymerase sigma factor n=1 Tax=Roseobacter sp. HKCCA0434 TaxID=3079297 RepID=UPI002905F113|nr:sigma-70 family RNA polymerase sigma factor [Roseobacter sp. HKCCA0434]
MSSQEIEKLIARLTLRDRAAFDELFERCSAKLFGTCLRVLQDRAEAEEATQEAFVKIWRNADKYRSGGYSPISWMVAIARNTAIDRLRRQRGGHVEIDEAVQIPDGHPGPEAQLLAGDTARQISDCLGKLPEERADAVRRAYLEGYSYAELAERHSVPLNTMRTWLRRSLIALRECMGGAAETEGA